VHINVAEHLWLSVQEVNMTLDEIGIPLAKYNRSLSRNVAAIPTFNNGMVNESYVRPLLPRNYLPLPFRDNCTQEEYGKRNPAAFNCAPKSALEEARKTVAVAARAALGKCVAAKSGDNWIHYIVNVTSFGDSESPHNCFGCMRATQTWMDPATEMRINHLSSRAGMWWEDQWQRGMLVPLVKDPSFHTLVQCVKANGINVSKGCRATPLAPAGVTYLHKNLTLPWDGGSRNPWYDTRDILLPQKTLRDWWRNPDEVVTIEC